MRNTEAKITSTNITAIDRNDFGLVCEILLDEARPASFEDADIALATVSLGRTGAWELAVDGVVAEVTEIDNKFNGVVAARIWDKVKVSHSEWELVRAGSVEDGDLISDRELCAAYVVAGSRTMDGEVKLHMVGEGKTWNDRHTSVWDASQLVMVARKA